MGKCKKCGAEIEDGEEYCESCLLLSDLGMDAGISEIQESESPHNELEFLDDLNIDPEFLNENEMETYPSAIEAAAGVEEKSTKEPVMPLDDNNEEEPIMALDDGGSDILGGMDDIISLDDTLTNGLSSGDKTSDVSDIISDALGVLNDTGDLDKENEILSKDSKSQKADKKEPKEKKGLFKKLFANVETDEEDPQPLEEELKKLEEEKKAKKQERDKQKKEAKEAKKKAAEAKKKEKEAKRKEKKRLREEAEKNLPVDHGRINKAGAAIVFLFFGTIAVFIIIGTNTFTYAHSVNSAKDYFDMQKYEQAYNALSGVDVKSKDKTTYEKINTVMIVEKQLNSYQNYYKMKMYPEALDSLIKGLKRYNGNIKTAKKLNVDSDLNSIKKEIVSALKKSYGLSESDVSDLVTTESQEKYSEQIYRLSEKK